jgi:hypothetical protein
MNESAKHHLSKAAQAFYDALANEPDFPGAWLDGFLNCIQHGHSSHDDPEEEPQYSNYKAGAKAAEILLKLKPDQ